MPQPVQRVERALRMAPEIRRWARAIEDDRVRNVLGIFGGIVRMRRGVEPLVWNAAPFQLGEQRFEPVRMLVVDRERLLVSCDAHVALYVRDDETRNKP